MIAAQAQDFVGNEQFTVHGDYLDYPHTFAGSSILLTDYSSVAFDFGYLKRPVVYTQFDKERFYASHTYDEGYFDYERDGFGPVCTDLESTVDALITLIEQGCALAPCYLDRINRFTLTPMIKTAGAPWNA